MADTRMTLMELALHYERQAMLYAPKLFSENGLPKGWADDPQSHEAEVAYVANCFTVAASLRARAQWHRWMM